MAQGPVRISLEDGIALITIDRPPVNALSVATLDALSTALDEAAGLETRAVVITGAGTRAFVAGADITELTAIPDSEAAYRFAAYGQAIFDRVEAFPKLVVAAINGPCLGGGNELAMACHVRIAAERARFGQPEINLGVIPGFGGTQRLPRLIGRGRALEVLLTGEMVSAADALQMGLVNRVVPDDQVVPAAMELARQVAAKSQVAVRLTLEAVREGLSGTLAEGQRIEREKFAQVMATEDRREGTRAFLEKRAPRFRDR